MTGVVLQAARSWPGATVAHRAQVAEVVGRQQRRPHGGGGRRTGQKRRVRRVDDGDGHGGR